ncbi:hypothetical protein A7U60_g1125 [Sanghuangporus baumii]|uniref:DUF6534 domain-containing protein n=1 Tax=Sanghuangporus baumii TaxID=108892 RepID=A0A9Q5I4Z5_SANBA|nr:hypothetical protein A7U60_g1125 [Sanghuangporus baumii]
MSSTDIISGSELDITWGCYFIGLPLTSALTSALWGVGCLQLYLYFENYWKTDQRWLKLYILIIWMLDTAHQVLVIHYDYIYFVKGIMEPELLTLLPRSLITTAALTGIVDAMIQAILVRRVWVLSDRNRILTGFMSAAVLAQFTVTMACYVEMFNITRFSQLYEIVHLELAFTCVAVFADTFLAAALIWLLWKARSGLRSSDSLVNRLVVYIVGSSLVTVLCMVIAVVSAIVAPHSFIYMTADTIIPKLYFNCLLASLNARSNLRENLVIHAGDISFRFTDPSSGSEGRTNARSQISSKALALVSARLRENDDIEAARHEQRTLIHIVPFTGTINAMIQVILVRRAWWLSDKNQILTGILGMSVLAQFTITVACYVKIFNFTNFTELYEVVHLEFSFTCVAVFTDTLLAVTLVWLLWKARSGFPSSDSVVNRLVSYIIGSTLVTVLCMGTAVISALVVPNSFIYMTADTIIPKLYFNCLLVSLNARSNLRERLVAYGGDISLHFTGPSTNLQGCLNTRSPKVTTLVSVGCQSDIDIEAGSHEQ